MINREYRNLLNLSEKEIYDDILKSFLSFERVISISKIIGTSSIEKIFNYILLDNPEIYYIDNYLITQNGLGQIKIKPEYKVSLYEKMKYDFKLDEIVNSIISKIKGNNDWEKIVSLHYILCRNITYDLDNNNAHNIIGALIDKHAVCDGISKAFKFICDKLNIPSVVATGSANSQTLTINNTNHAWNKVCVFGNWCNLDVTFDLTISFNKYIRHDYFLVSDKSLHMTHNQILSPLKLNCLTDDYCYYEVYKMLASSPSELVSYIKANVSKDKRIFEVKMKNVMRIDLLEEKIEKALKEAFLSEDVFKYKYSLNKEMSTLYIEFIV